MDPSFPFWVVECFARTPSKPTESPMALRFSNHQRCSHFSHSVPVSCFRWSPGQSSPTKASFPQLDTFPHCWSPQTGPLKVTNNHQATTLEHGPFRFYVPNLLEYVRKILPAVWCIRANSRQNFISCDLQPRLTLVNSNTEALSWGLVRMSFIEVFEKSYIPVTWGG